MHRYVPFLSGSITDTSVAPQLVTFIEKSPFLSSNNLIWSFLEEPWTNPEEAKKSRHNSTKILVIVFSYEAIKEIDGAYRGGIARENF